MRKTTFVIGLKWFDKVNGNTYCRPVVFLDDGSRLTDSYEYGYGDYYMEIAKRICKENDIEFNCPPHTDKWVKKSELRNEYYY